MKARIRAQFTKDVLHPVTERLTLYFDTIVDNIEDYPDGGFEINGIWYNKRFLVWSKVEKAEDEMED